jgi:hypothetical protein
MKDGKRVLTETPPLLTEDEFNRYPAVFEGTVKRIDRDFLASNTCTDCYRDLVVSFAVSKVWRGQLGNEYKVRTPYGGPACEYHFEVGGTYLVYVKEGTKDFNYGVSRCSRTKLISAAADEVQLLYSWVARGKGSP